ncbi:MAG: Gfo/Idh/MocA family oxidoreductase [Halioglobus sp.]|nr:Gfo/Idh/MocA family oxidoreductase [Halioglobus sp.]
MNENKNRKNTLNRREFTRRSTLLAGATLLGSNASALHASGSDTLKVAVIGCGGRGTGAARQALKADPGVEVVALADAFEDRAAKCAKVLRRVGGKRATVPEERIFTGFTAFREATDLADVVILATPPGFRPEHFEYAVSRGRHIFMEKPVATDAFGVRRVLAAARKAHEQKLNVVVGLQRHYQPSYLEALERYRSGAIGDIVAGQVYWNSSGVWVRPREAGQTEMAYQMRNWYYFNWLCGDHILEQHIHNIDVANWFLGELPASAQGMGGREVRKGADHGEIFDHHFVEFTYPSGAVISSQCRHQTGCVEMVEERFQATGGSLFTSGGNDAVLKNRAGDTLYKHGGLFDPSPYQIEHDQLFASMRAGGHIDNADYGAHATLTAIMGRMATYTGKRISWDKALNASQRLVPDSGDLHWNSAPPTVPDDAGNYRVPVPGKTRI